MKETTNGITYGVKIGSDIELSQQNMNMLWICLEKLSYSKFGMLVVALF